MEFIIIYFITALILINKFSSFIKLEIRLKSYLQSLSKLNNLTKESNNIKVVMNNISKTGTKLLFWTFIFITPYLILLTFMLLNKINFYFSLILPGIPYFRLLKK